MREILNGGLLILGFAFLIKGADYFVDGSALIAKKFGIPSVIVGLTIVSLGTSAPELAVSTISALNGNNGIAIGNVLGSNIFNTLVVLGGTAIVMPFFIKRSEIKKDFSINILVIAILYIVSFGVVLNWNNGLLDRKDGLILILLCFIYTFTLIKYAIKKNVTKEKHCKNIKILKNLLKIFIGLIGIILGGELVVDGASALASSLGMSSKLVGLTVVAMGTSLPELITSIVASLKGENEIAMGNILGSNIFNILLILGVSSTINPITIASGLRIDIMFLLIVTLFIGMLIFINKSSVKRFTRIEGCILVITYFMYLVFIISRN